MKRKVPKLIYSWIKVKIIEKIQFYAERPWLIGKELTAFYHRRKYNFWCIVDPPPIQKKNELTEDYFDRIDPKYGLRFYETLIYISLGIDLESTLPHVNKDFKDKKIRKDMREFLITVAQIEQENIERYKKFLFRNEIQKNQNT